ncbi:PepSY domain-containing protein [Hydrogenimonas sp. SS33]|uniref:PepSY domain-containing protein n=1 Tax=Hydrogenimonas leucolamina TaxID=2954236 RepID=UPI00336C0C6D
MVKLHRWHRRFGLTAGAVLFLLALTGFFLDHDQWRFLYAIRLPFTGHALKHAQMRLIEGYIVRPSRGNEAVVCSKRGIFVSADGASGFRPVLERTCNGLVENGGKLYAATDDGIYEEASEKRWRRLALPGAWVNTLSAHGQTLFASVDKSLLYLIDAAQGRILQSGEVKIGPKELGFAVKLSRFIRDLHYGRGLFEDPWSLALNDYGAWVLLWLSIGGFILWWHIRRRRGGKGTRRFIRLHANVWSVAAIVPLSLLAVTGIFLDHAGALAGFMRSVTVPGALLPPVYRSLRHDIWSVDYDGSTFRIGNRYGVYGSPDMKRWHLENRGFAYRLLRHGETLYISGMGAPNRILNAKGYAPLPHTPHMFKSVVERPDGKRLFFSSHRPNLPLPRFEDATLYALLLTLHDGSLFADGWRWVNDYAAVALLLLFVTGTVRWWRLRFQKRQTMR